MMMSAVAVMSASVKLPSAFASAFFALNFADGLPSKALITSTMSATVTTPSLSPVTL